jgi:hypothetical protein
VRISWKDPATVARLVGALGLLVLIFALAKVLSQKDQRRSGSNYVDVAHFIAQVSAGSEICQDESIPKDTGGVRMLLTSYTQPTPTLRLAFKTLSGRVISRGTLRAGRWIEGTNTIPLSPVRETTQGRFCIRNAGPAPMTPGGENFDPSMGALVDGQPVAGLMSVQFMLPGVERWLDVAPLVLGRVRHGKSEWFGPWMPALYVLLVLTCIGGATSLVVRR